MSLIVTCVIELFLKNKEGIFMSTYKKFAWVIFAWVLLIILSYFYLDKPVAFYVYNHNYGKYLILTWFAGLTALPILFAFGFYFFFMGKYLLTFVTPNDYRLLAIANSVAIASFLKEQFKYIFGRCWPLTWINNNPSLIKDNVYGCNFFHGGAGFSAFPSGHTCITFAATVLIWEFFPKLRWFAVLLSTLVMMGLIGMDYHFLSDVLSGALLGTLVALSIGKVSKSHWHG